MKVDPNYRESLHVLAASLRKAADTLDNASLTGVSWPLLEASVLSVELAVANLHRHTR